MVCRLWIPSLSDWDLDRGVNFRKISLTALDFRPGAEPDQLVGGGQQHLEELVQGGVGVADHQERRTRPPGHLLLVPQHEAD